MYIYISLHMSTCLYRHIQTYTYIHTYIHIHYMHIHCITLHYNYNYNYITLHHPTLDNTTQHNIKLTSTSTLIYNIYIYVNN